ncbi:hypothetical protein B0H16DRAFT_1720021 [Mycena metata]|uniref:F-box domain-containing protein n=1 Tax=Mycena metata TaxID=1033252 RepID=A0AAD7JDP3_9AGAR|nr:hypothetical protein B0H16DRAFT_1720021 [Mycena metata]
MTQGTFSLLPNEILAEIFRLACTTSDDTLKSLSHVCRFFRNVALTPQLWTNAVHYEHDHPEWVKEQLTRAAGLPVVVKAHFPMHSDRGIQNLHLVLKESPIHTLDIQGPPEIMDQLWENLDAGFLRSLSLFIPWEQMPKTNPYPGPAFKLNAPRLRTLSLSNFIAWDASINNLTHLRLHLQDPTFAPSIAQILGMLASSPMLAELILLHSIESSSRLPSHESIDVVTLSHLAVFLLDDDISNHIFLLRHIDIPAHCTLSLKVEHRANNLLAELGRSISTTSLSLDRVEKLDIEGGPSHLTIRGYTPAKHANPLIQLTLRCPARYLDSETASIAGMILASLPLIAPMALELVFCHPHSASTPANAWQTSIPVNGWERCLQHLGTVQSLQVKPTTPPNLLSALSASVNGVPVVLPLLRSLELHHPEVITPLKDDVSTRKKPPQLGAWWQKSRNHIL